MKKSLILIAIVIQIATCIRTHKVQIQSQKSNNQQIFGSSIKNEYFEELKGLGDNPNQSRKTLDYMKGAVKSAYLGLGQVMTGHHNLECDEMFTNVKQSRVLVSLFPNRIQILDEVHDDDIVRNMKISDITRINYPKVWIDNMVDCFQVFSEPGNQQPIQVFNGDVYAMNNIDFNLCFKNDVQLKQWIKDIIEFRDSNCNYERIDLNNQKMKKQANVRAILTKIDQMEKRISNDQNIHHRNIFRFRKYESKINEQKEINDNILQQIIDLNKKEIMLKKQQIRNVDNQISQNNLSLRRMKKKVYQDAKLEVEQEHKKQMEMMKMKMNNNIKIRKMRRLKKKSNKYFDKSSLSSQLNQLENKQKEQKASFRFRKILNKSFSNQLDSLQKRLSEYQGEDDEQQQKLIDNLSNSNNAIERQMGKAFKNGKVKTLKNQSNGESQQTQMEQGRPNNKAVTKQQKLMDHIQETLDNMRGFIKRRTNNFQQLRNQKQNKNHDLKALSNEYDKLLGNHKKQKKHRKSKKHN